MTGLRQLLEAMREAFAASLRNRLLLVALLGALLVSLVAPLLVAARGFASEVLADDFFGVGAYLLGLQGGLPLLACALGADLVHREIADRSATHVFVRPVPRATLLLGRWLAGSLCIAVLLGLLLALAWLALSIPELDWRRREPLHPAVLRGLALGAALAAPAYVAVGCVAGAVFRRPVVWSVVFVLGWEVIASNSPPQAGVRVWTVADPLRRFLLGTIAPPEGDGLHSVLLGSARRFDPAEFPDPLRSLAWFTAIALAVALLVYTRREYDSRSRD
ncbi:MAG: ABC transporter permease [Planctomycetes bacterium]|nr:ABC transporter permease [Planctomycetota bacterium]